jgi:hypothetical protein
MYFIAKTPLGEFKSVYSDNEHDNKIVRKTLTESLSLLTHLNFECDLGEDQGVVHVSLGPDVLKNSVFIIVE